MWFFCNVFVTLETNKLCLLQLIKILITLVKGKLETLQVNFVYFEYMSANISATQQDRVHR